MVPASQKPFTQKSVKQICSQSLFDGKTSSSESGSGSPGICQLLLQLYPPCRVVTTFTAFGVQFPSKLVLPLLIVVLLLEILELPSQALDLVLVLVDLSSQKGE